MRKLAIFCLLTGLAGMMVLPGRLAASPAGKNFSIVYSQDERGAITPCG